MLHSCKNGVAFHFSNKRTVFLERNYAEPGRYAAEAPRIQQKHAQPRFSFLVGNDCRAGESTCSCHFSRTHVGIFASFTKTLVSERGRKLMRSALANLKRAFVGKAAFSFVFQRLRTTRNPRGHVSSCRLSPPSLGTCFSECYPMDGMVLVRRCSWTLESTVK